jgi:hypothetical protein
MSKITDKTTENPSVDDGLIEVIKPETLVSIPMSSGYYKKIQAALGAMINGKTNEELQSAHQQIATQTIAEEWITHYETLLILAREFEETARKEGFITKVTKEEAAELLKDFIN